MSRYFLTYRKKCIEYCIEYFKVGSCECDDFFFFFDVRLRITAAVLLDLKRRLNQILSGQLSLQAFAIWTLCPSSQWTHNEIVCVPN